MNAYWIKLREEDCQFLLSYISKHNITSRGKRISIGMAVVSIVENFCYEQQQLDRELNEVNGNSLDNTNTKQEPFKENTGIVSNPMPIKDNGDE